MGKILPAKTNGLDPEKSKSYVARIENLYGDMDKLKSDHMLKCKAIREDIKEVYKEAKLDGYPKRSLQAVITVRTLERKAAEAYEALSDDIDVQDKYDAIRHDLGDLADLPLGKAALKAAGNGAAVEGAPV